MAEANPTCPFCFAPWSEKMVRQLEASTLPGGCGCCIDGPSAAHVVSWPIAAEPAPEPEDIACSACGKVLYAAFTG
jgi:hypothetical protein